MHENSSRKQLQADRRRQPAYSFTGSTPPTLHPAVSLASSTMLFLLSILTLLSVALVIHQKSGFNLAVAGKKKRGSVAPHDLQVYVLRTKATIDRRAKAYTAQLYSETCNHGALNIAMTCPYCSYRGSTRTRKVTEKRGISSGKATAAILSGGSTLLVVGLSRMQQSTEAWCGSCRNVWVF